MRIISKWHDYYDTIQKHGMDAQCVYIRDTEFHHYDEVVKRNRYGHRDNLLRDHVINNEQFSVVVIGFCGRLYMCWHQRKTLINPGKTIYSTEDLKNLLAEEKKARKYWRYYKNITNMQEAEQVWAGDIERMNREKRDIFQEIRAPIFLLRTKDSGPVIEVNPKLSDYEFYRIVEPYSAFQNIHQYLSGVLGGVRETIPEVSNNDMIEAKGFDLKESFRKPPSKRKRK